MTEPERAVPREDGRTIFDRMAERMSDLVGGAWFFIGAVLLVVLWLPFAFIVKSIDTWQLVLSTVTSVAAFLLLALLQNTERRNTVALHRKVDMLAAALATQLRRSEAAAADPEVEQAAADLEASMRLEERM